MTMFRILLSAILSAFLMVCHAQVFETGKKYRIESNFDKSKNNRSGALGLGANHGSDSRSFYVKGGTFSQDCWWYIEPDGNGYYLIRNAQTGEYMGHKKRYEDIALVGESSIDKNSRWRIKENVGCFVLYVRSDEQYLLHFGSTNNDNTNASTDRMESVTPFILFNIYDEAGSKLNPFNLPDSQIAAAEIPSASSDLKSYVTDIAVNGRKASYSSKTKWLAVLPKTEAVSLTFTSVQDGATVTLMDGDKEITKTSELQTKKEYQLIVSKNGTKKAESTISFTTLPILDIRHEGKLGTGMLDYLWGEMHLSDADTPETLVLSSRFKSRGATASKYSKHSMNMKLRNAETDAEEDSTLLGMRSSSSWILDAMAIDRTNMRNRVCFDLWNDMYKLPYETKFGSRCGTIGRYVELFENGEYKGLYCLTDRINRKLLDLKKPKIDPVTGEGQARGLLYKAGSWDCTGLEDFQRSQYISLYGDTRNSALWCNWELVEPEDYPSPEAWAPLDALYDNAGAVQYYKNNFLIDNVVDYHLFILAMHIVDNGNKNEFIAIKNITKTGTDETKMFFVPWDLDTSLGGSFDGSNYGGDYLTVAPQSMKITQNYPFKQLFTDSDYLQAIRNRWIATRDGVLSPNNILKK